MYKLKWAFLSLLSRPLEPGWHGSKHGSIIQWIRTKQEHLKNCWMGCHETWDSRSLFPEDEHWCYFWIAFRHHHELDLWFWVKFLNKGRPSAQLLEWSTPLSHPVSCLLWSCPINKAIQRPNNKIQNISTTTRQITKKSGKDTHVPIDMKSFIFKSLHFKSGTIIRSKSNTFFYVRINYIIKSIQSSIEIIEIRCSNHFYGHRCINASTCGLWILQHTKRCCKFHAPNFVGTVWGWSLPVPTWQGP